MAMPSATGFIRGDTYYVADGSYGAKSFSTVASGASPITIKHAVAGDHGTDTGWASTPSGGQAVFSGWTFTTAYWTVEGQTFDANWWKGVTGTSYGFRTAQVALNPGNNLTFNHVEIMGGGRDTGNHDELVHATAGGSTVAFSYCALHDNDGVMIHMDNGWDHFTVDHTLMARNTSRPTWHGEGLSVLGNTSAVVFSNDSVIDVEGTATWALANGGSHTHWRLYNNTVQFSSRYECTTQSGTCTARPSVCDGVGNCSAHNVGLVGVIDGNGGAGDGDAAIDDLLFYNNTVMSVPGTGSGTVLGTNAVNSFSYNNIWGNSVRLNHGYATQGWNGYDSLTFTTNSGYPDGDNESSTTHYIVCTSGTCGSDYFVSVGGLDLHLVQHTPAGSNVGSPYSLDKDGNSRTGHWDRGAYEYVAP
jgi:hypothetical protein